VLILYSSGTPIAAVSGFTTARMVGYDPFSAASAAAQKISIHPDKKIRPAVISDPRHPGAVALFEECEQGQVNGHVGG
jgi:hypothetical protein